MPGKITFVLAVVLSESTLCAAPGKACLDTSPTIPQMHNPIDPGSQSMSPARAVPLRNPILLQDVCEAERR